MSQRHDQVAAALIPCWVSTVVYRRVHSAATRIPTARTSGAQSRRIQHRHRARMAAATASRRRLWCDACGVGSHERGPLTMAKHVRRRSCAVPLGHVYFYINWNALLRNYKSKRFFNWIGSLACASFSFFTFSVTTTLVHQVKVRSKKVFKRKMQFS